ncbi:MAG: DedA family protein [Chroococcales cyanobacterium]
MVEWITNIMNTLGYWGIGLLMFLENVFPPIPSELIMPLAGFTIAQGKMEFLPAIAAGVIGTILGAFFWYYLGKLTGERRLKYLANKYGKWAGVSSEDIETAQHWFSRYGNIAVFFGRFVPAVRTLISLPAGINHMSLIPFLAYSTLGTIIWVGLLTYLGYILGANYSLVEQYLGTISKIIVIALVIAVIIFILKRRSNINGD